MTYEQARDIIFKVFQDAWNPRYIVWPDTADKVPDILDPWARVIYKHSGGGQSSLSGDVGTKRYNRFGILVIQVFTPVGRGQTQSYQLASMVANAYEDAKLDVWFRNIRLKEQGANGAYDQIDVLTDFLYDEVR